eukprot:gene8115-9666_t
MTSVFRKIGDLYTRCLTRSPTATNCITGFLVGTIGDVACQKYFEKAPSRSSEPSEDEELQEDKKVDLQRAGELGLIRATLVTPFCQWWYAYLQRLAPGNNQVFKRVAIDSAIGSPLVICMVFAAKGTIASLYWNAVLSYYSNKDNMSVADVIDNTVEVSSSLTNTMKAS